MADPFEDITVSHFAAGPEDQDSDRQYLFRFQFFLSAAAPELWVRLAGADLGDGQHVSPSLKRQAWACQDRIVVRCLPDDAQEVKDALNAHVLPDLNLRYRREKEAARLHPRAETDQQQAILGDVKRAVRDQM
jgi:hypothetical protein